MKKIGIGLLGFGTVGAGVVKGLQKNAALLKQRLGCELALARIADIDTTRDRGVTLAPGVLTDDAMSVINDPSIQIIIELIGGCGVAKKFMLAAIEAGKHVVTANKKLLAEHGAEIFSAAERKGVEVYFGASVGGGIPIIRVLREGLVANEARAMHGILNGTCNYILTRMEREGVDFDAVLKAAQEAGYAEANPSLDIDGHDTAHKAAILASIAYGFHVPADAISVEGIRSLSGADVKFARELGYRIKLLAVVRREDDTLDIRVHPALLPRDAMLASVNGVFNAVMVRGDLTGDTLYYGRGAGSDPTASTVIADLADIARNLAQGGPRHKRGISCAAALPRIKKPSEIRSRYYLRLMVKDEPGTLGAITTALGSRRVSIMAVTQHEAVSQTVPVPVVVLTHAALEADLDAALADIVAGGILCEAPVRLRIVDE